MRALGFSRSIFAAFLVAITIVGCARRPVLSPRAVLATRAHSRARALDAVRVFERHQLALRDSIVRLALAQVGTPYEFGGITPEMGFDCSGLVRYVFARVYLTPPRTASQQARIGAPIRRDRLRPGDLLAFGIGDSVTHIGIYVGERKYVHASSVAGRVIVSPINRPPSDLIKPLKGARRVLLGISDPFDRAGGF
jgi:cell wall-associated NlpC family hydrolase